MPVGTYGTVKAMTPEELQGMGVEIILGNTFHLMLRPGTEVISRHGDLHRFMHWEGPILTDSGGFQVWSLAARRRISEEGVRFQAPTDGSEVFLSPEVSMQVQRDLGADIVMIFDECTPYPASESEARKSMELSLRWAARSKAAHTGNPNALFGIVQGGTDPELRAESAAAKADDGSYRGLVAGRSADVVIDGSSFLVKPEVAAKQVVHQPDRGRQLAVAQAERKLNVGRDGAVAEASDNGSCAPIAAETTASC